MKAKVELSPEELVYLMSRIEADVLAGDPMAARLETTLDLALMQEEETTDADLR